MKKYAKALGLSAVVVGALAIGSLGGCEKKEATPTTPAKPATPAAPKAPAEAPK